MPGLCDNNVFSLKYEGLYEMILFPPECVEENRDLYLPSQFLKASSEYTFGGYSSSSSFSRRTFSLRNDFRELPSSSYLLLEHNTYEENGISLDLFSIQSTPLIRLSM